MTNPYRSLPDHHFWKRSVTEVVPHKLNPVVDPKFEITKDMKVATAGSCFAQHIARVLNNSGFNYFVPEDAPELDETERAFRGYGLFSARFGNIYTASQLLQLIQEAYGLRLPLEKPWKRPDGKFVDPFRPTVEPNGFISQEDVVSDRAEHLAAVRKMVEESDVFMFTLGLTEAWRSIGDESVFPLVPGAVAGYFDEAMYEFHNFAVDEVIADLTEAFLLMKSKNQNLQSILTVSPVPLIATYEKKHVLVSTTYSKSVLRVAAETLSRERDWIDYFPSYEVITGGFNRGRYYEEDLREVNSLGVGHAMRLFMENYAPQKPTQGELTAAPRRLTPDCTEVVCDEEQLDVTSI